jgi:hypothetical protein
MTACASGAVIEGMGDRGHASGPFRMASHAHRLAPGGVVVRELAQLPVGVATRARRVLSDRVGNRRRFLTRGPVADSAQQLGAPFVAAGQWRQLASGVA